MGQVCVTAISSWVHEVSYVLEVGDCFMKRGGGGQPQCQMLNQGYC